MATRRAHRKTRTGCQACKRRKVKCDETKPICNNCIKHSMECEFSTIATQASLNGRSSSDSFWNNIDSPSSTSPEHNGSLNLRDLELLYHFTTQTCNTLHSDPVQKTMWRVTVPGIAVTHDFVMREILALSAMHLGYLRAEQREFYQCQGLHHHQHALRRVSTILPNITNSNCSALYAFSALASIFTLASPQKPDDFLVVSDSGLADWALLLRGTKSIIDSSELALHQGPLSPMFAAGDRRARLRDGPMDGNSDEAIQLDMLQTLVEKFESNQADLDVYTEAIAELKRSFTVLCHRPFGFETTDVFIWVFRVSEEYLMLLRTQTQISLCIFAYFCVILQQLETKWWGEGRSHRLMSEIYILLDEEHRWWVRWPMEVMSWAPSPQLASRS